MPIALAALLLARPTKILLFFPRTIDSSLPHYKPLHRHLQQLIIFLSLARDVPAALQRRPSKSIELESNPCLRDPALLLNCEVFLDSLLPGRTSVVHYTRLTDTTRHNNTAAAPGQRFTRTASSTACPSQRLFAASAEWRSERVVGRVRQSWKSPRHIGTKDSAAIRDLLTC